MVLQPEQQHPTKTESIGQYRELHFLFYLICVHGLFICDWSTLSEIPSWTRHIRHRKLICSFNQMKNTCANGISLNRCVEKLKGEYVCIRARAASSEHSSYTVHKIYNNKRQNFFSSPFIYNMRKWNRRTRAKAPPSTRQRSTHSAL